MTVGEIWRGVLEHAERSPFPLVMEFDDQTDTDYDWNVEEGDEARRKKTG